MSDADNTNMIGPLGAVHCETIDLGFTTEVDKTTVFVSFLNHSTVDQFAKCSLKVAITDIKVVCGGTLTCSLIPDSWGLPPSADLKDPTKGIALCPGLCMTTLYTPHVTPIMSAFLSPQIKPKLLIGEPMGLLMYSHEKVTATITFKLHRHGIMPPKPY
jgi:hypothetical protein